jgi:hypothetical protein|tara:strand:+ start:2021 stop:2326 length:306 start_codon:yes stop_codon:yes gene_type:complete
MDSKTTADSIRPTPIWQQQLPVGIEKCASELFEDELSTLYFPDLIILPLTPEGKEQREWLINYQHNEGGRLVHQSVFRYGATEHNFEYNNETYLAILVNND